MSTSLTLYMLVEVLSTSLTLHVIQKKIHNTILSRCFPYFLLVSVYVIGRFLTVLACATETMRRQEFRGLCQKLPRFRAILSKIRKISESYRHDIKTWLAHRNFLLHLAIIFHCICACAKHV